MEEPWKKSIWEVLWEGLWPLEDTLEEPIGKRAGSGSMVQGGKGQGALAGLEGCATTQNDLLRSVVV